MEIREAQCNLCRCRIQRDEEGNLLGGAGLVYSEDARVYQFTNNPTGDKHLCSWCIRRLLDGLTAQYLCGTQQTAAKERTTEA